MLRPHHLDQQLCFAIFFGAFGRRCPWHLGRWVSQYEYSCESFGLRATVSSKTHRVTLDDGCKYSCADNCADALVAYAEVHDAQEFAASMFQCYTEELERRVNFNEWFRENFTRGPIRRTTS